MSSTAAPKTICVYGAGVIGCSWAALFLAYGHKVLVTDPAPDASSKVKTYIEEAWPSLAAVHGGEDGRKGNWEFVLPGSGEGQIESRLKEADLVQESGPERPDIKISIYNLLDKFTRSDCIIGSSSSGLPSSTFVTEMHRPERVIIAHPFNPPHIMPLVELVPHPGTSQEVISDTDAFFKSVGRTPILVRKEVPGFVGNRLQAALVHEAESLFANGVCSAKDIDSAVINGLGARWALTGPFMTMILGGGGNPAGYTRIRTHIGAASNVWLEDMEKSQLKVSDTEGQKRLISGVEAELGETDTHSLTLERDALLTEVIALRAKITEGQKNVLKDYYV